MIKGFEYKCTCDWSKDNEFGFIPNTECPVHGKATKETLSKCVPIRDSNKTSTAQQDKEKTKTPDLHIKSTAQQ